MKRYIIFPSVLLIIFTLITFFIKSTGYFGALFMRNDLLYFMLIIPAYLIFYIVGMSYMLFGINFKENILNQWEKMFAMVVMTYLFLINVFIPDIYITTAPSTQILLTVVGLLSIIGYTTSIVLKERKNNAK